MPVDIVHVVPAFFPTRGGIEVLLENLVPYLNAHSRFTHAVLAPRVNNERPDSFVLRNTEVLSVDARHPEAIQRHREGREHLPYEKEFARVFLRTKQHLRASRPRLIHMHGISLVGNAVSAIAGAERIPVVMHLHGSVGGALSEKMQQQLHDSVEVIAVSDFVRRSIEVETGRTAGVHVIRNGVPDPSIYLPKDSTIGEPAAITLVGRLEPAKGFDVALRALGPIAPEFPALRVNIVGVGEELGALQHLAHQLGLGNLVRFHGRLEHAETLSLMRASRCVVVPSVQYEGFSLVALEAGLLEVPVVASNVGGLPETVLDGITGLIINPLKLGELTRAIRTYLQDPELATDHGRNARARALEEFTLERMATEIQRLHELAIPRER
jgi:glycosyltransferase involved in cell wall biosynthesis